MGFRDWNVGADIDPMGRLPVGVGMEASARHLTCVGADREE
jgi:hypothetical protein